MDFARKLDQAQNLSDLFELVKRAVEAVLGRTRAGLMLALADLGNHPQGFLGAFYPVASNVIVMNKVPLLRIQETNPNLYKPYAFYVLLHEYLHSLGFVDERVCREQSHRILETLFGVDALVTQISGDTTRFFPNLVFPDAAWQPSELSLEFVRGFDPAVTLGALVGRQITPRLAAVYWGSQLLGALVAAFGLSVIFPASVWQASHLGTPALGSPPGLSWTVTPAVGILVEAILTFLLVFVVYGTGIDPKGSFNAVGGFAIGLTISIDIMMGGPLTGAAMNPARWFGPAVVSQFFDNWYVYWIGPFLGAIVAGLLYSRACLDKARGKSGT